MWHVIVHATCSAILHIFIYYTFIYYINVVLWYSNIHIYSRVITSDFGTIIHKTNANTRRYTRAHFSRIIIRGEKQIWFKDIYVYIFLNNRIHIITNFYVELLRFLVHLSIVHLCCFYTIYFYRRVYASFLLTV